jgi:hypothetical protein
MVLAGNYDEPELGGEEVHVTQGREKRNSHRILVGKPEGAQPPLETEEWMKGYL